jgi:DNA polymerase-3 subunit alpha
MNPGMQKYMKELKPTVFRFDCMNALYRGPLPIFQFCKRKKMGKRKLFMTLACEELLKILMELLFTRTGNAFVSKLADSQR